MPNWLKFQMQFMYDRGHQRSRSRYSRHMDRKSTAAVNHLENWSRLAVRGVQAFFFLTRELSRFFLPMMWLPSMTIPNCIWHSRIETCCKISARKRWAIPHTRWIWHPVIFTFFTPWRTTFRGIVSLMTKTSKMFPARVWRNRNMRSIRPGWTDLSHVVTIASAFRGLTFINGTTVTCLLFVISFLY